MIVKLVVSECLPVNLLIPLVLNQLTVVEHKECLIDSNVHIDLVILASILAIVLLPRRIQVSGHSKADFNEHESCETWLLLLMFNFTATCHRVRLS